MMFGPLLAASPGERHTHFLKLHRGPHFGEVSNVPLHPKRPRFPPIRRNGTTAAKRYLTLGVAANSAPTPTGRGGARNRADRVSHCLSAAQVASLMAAAGHASEIGLPLNRLTTIHWETAGVPLEAMARATGRFVDRLSKAVARHGAGTAWLWVHENGDGKGGHCHLLAHVPPVAVGTITKRQKGWLKGITDRPYKRRVILSRPIGGRVGLEATNPALHAVNLQTAISYCLKGADPAAAAAFQLPRCEPGGRIIGKRCATSQNIGPKARLEARP